MDSLNPTLRTSMDLVVVQLDKARQALVQAKTIQETKQVLDVSAAAEIYARRQQLGEDAINYAREVKVEALRQLGVMLKETPLAKGGQPYQGSTGSKSVPVETLSQLGLDKKTSSLAQKIADLPEEQFEKVKSGVVALSKAHVAHNSGNNEWYTPPEIITAAREAMGGIDLDPASSELANHTVGAASFYTAENDGLKKRWRGNVWMNPPYAQPLIELFCEKLLKSYFDRSVAQACVLVNNATETAWGQGLLSSCDAVCFLAGRVRFLDSTGKPSGAPLQGQMIAYFGNNRAGFAAAFQKIGVVFVTRPNL